MTRSRALWLPRFFPWWPCSMAVLALCCATVTQPVSPSRPVVEFPRPEALEAIEARPASIPRVDDGPIPAAGWTVELGAAVASAHEPWAPTNAWDRAVFDAIARSSRRPLFTRALGCAAREFGRYALQHGKAPPLPLREFIAGACGVVAPRVDFTSLGGEMASGVSDDALLQQWRGGMAGVLVDRLPAGAHEVGFALVRRGRRVSGVLAFAETLVQFEPPLSLVPTQNGDVVVAGQLKADIGYVAGYINQGPFGVDACFIDPAVKRPAFRIVCRVAPEDAMARIDLVYTQPRRVLAFRFAHLLARRPGMTALKFHDEPSVEARPLGAGAEFVPAVVADLNRIRARASLPPVRLASAQSATATRLATHYFAAAKDPVEIERMDTIALGLLAGWQVNSGLIRDGKFVSLMLPGSHDAGSWLKAALAAPIGRVALMTVSVEEVALGPVLLSESNAVAAVAVGYSFHHDSDHASDENRLLARVVGARAEGSLPAPKRLAGMAEVFRDVLKDVREGKAQPAEALDSALRHGARRLRASVRGYLVEATSLDGLQIPEEVLRQPTLDFEIGVTHYKPPGAAWGQLVVLIVFIDHEAETI